MSWTTPEPPTPSTPTPTPTGWPATPPAVDVTPEPAPPAATDRPAVGGRRMAFAAAGVVGALLLGGTAYAVGQSTAGSTTSTAATSQGTALQAPGGGTSGGTVPQGVPDDGDGDGFGGRGPMGGLDGEQHVLGTLTKVSGSTITVTAQDGTAASWTVSDATQVLLDGAQVAVGDIPAGTAVQVHVLSGTDGADDVVERVLAGTSATQGPGGFGGPGMLPPGTAPDQQDGTAGTDGTTGQDTGLDV